MRIVKIIFGVLVLLSAIIFILFFGYIFLNEKVSQRLDIGYGIAKSNEIVHLQIGDVNFSIPKQYIWSREDWVGGVVDGVNMSAQLSTMKPLQLQIEKNSKKSPWHDYVSILISRRVDIDHIDNAYFSAAAFKRTLVNRQYSIKLNLYGLNQVIFEHALKTDRNLYFSGHINSPDFWTECSLPAPGKFPSCTAYIDVTKYVYVKYTFGYDELHRWKKIRSDVNGLISKIQSK